MTSTELKALRVGREMTMMEAARLLTKKLGRNVPITTLAHWEAGSMVIPDDVTKECFE